MKGIARLFSIRMPIISVMFVGFVALFGETYISGIVGNEYHRFTVMLGFLAAVIMAVGCICLQRWDEPSEPVADDGAAERERREKVAFDIMLERHEINMAIAKLEFRRLRQLIRENKRGW